MSRTIRVGIALALVAGPVALGSSIVFRAPQAQAACHIAAFTESAYSVDEDAGSVTVTVFLEGRQPECSGSVEVTTVDGSATAPQDYEATTQMLCFEPAGDRETDVQIAIVDDLVAEGDEQFAVQISDTNEASCQPDSITGNATTTVTIVDNDAQPVQPEPTQPPVPSPAPPAPAEPTPETTPTSSPSPTPAAATPTPSPSPTAIAVEDEEEAGSSTGLIAAAVAAVALAGTGAGLLFWRRRVV